MKKLLLLSYLIIATAITTHAQCWQTLASGGMHSLAIKVNGSLWAWGGNSSGQLGDGTTISKTIAVQTGTSTSWKSIACGSFHSLAIKTDGTLWTWGSNVYGQLGDGTLIAKSVPTQIGVATDWLFVNAGSNHSIAIKTDGTLWACGYNSTSQLGDGTTVDKSIFTQIGVANNWQSASGGQDFTMAIQNDGTLWGFGNNAFRALGDGTTTTRTIPTQIGVATNWLVVACGQAHSVAVKTDGTLWSWGRNGEGALGTATTQNNIPTQIGVATNWRAVAAYYRHSLATKIDGTLWGFGNNSNNDLGDGTTVNKYTPTQIGVATNWLYPAAGSYKGAAIKADGTAWSWGSNNAGQAGDGTTVQRASPVQVITTCAVGAALNLDGSDDYVSIGTVIPVNSSYTKEAWIYANASGSNNIVSSGSAAFWLAAGKLSAFNNGGSTIIDPAVFPLNQWVHVAVTFNSVSGVLSLYKNGILVNSGLSNSGYTNDAISIGDYPPVTGNSFSGSIDEVRIWNVARTLCEINTFKNCEIPTIATGLLANYHFNQGVASSPNSTVINLTDASASANTGTLTNIALTGSTSNWIAPGAVVNNFTTTLAPPSAIVTTTNVACNGGTSGSIVANTSGGTPTYSFLWSNGATTASITNISVGVYTRTVTDAASCSSTITATVLQPPAIVTSTAVTNVACNGGSNGVASITASGGVGGYTYLWSNGATISVITGLLAGAYTATVTDANSCTNIKSATVTQPSVLVTSTAVTNVACNGGSNGVASITASGGAGGYTYLWSNGGTTSAITGLLAGAYTATVTDANSCKSIKGATVTQPSAIVTSTAVTTIACNGGSNGVASITASGGAGGYTYLWSNGATTSAITGLMAGAYTATVTDANSCTNIKSATITQPSALVTSTVVTNVSCNGGSNGVATITASGGAGGYTYLWSNGATTSAITGVLAGVYSATVSDANSCTSIKNTTITQPSSNVSGTAVVTNVSCNGGSNGTINLTPNGGTPGYTFNWGGGVTTEDRTGLVAGNYTVTITDANSCTGVVNATVTQPTANVSGTTVVTNVSCNGGSNGTINLTPNGGIPGYTFNWGGGVTTEDRTGLVAGNYSVTITDANGCAAVINAAVTQLAAIGTSTSASNVSCNGGSNGLASVFATGGAGSFNYSWAPSGGTSSSASGLIQGTYMVTITDFNGCTATSNVTITEPTLLIANATASSILCNGGVSTVNVTANNGTPSYTGVGTFTAMAGTQTYNVTDFNGCIVTANVIITEPTLLTANTTVSSILCNGGVSTITVTANDGTPSYTGVGTFTAMVGTQTYTVTDANGCIATTSVLITEPIVLTANATASSILCNGGVSSVTVVANDGTPSYTGVGTFTAMAGTETFTVTDANGCIATTSISITQPAAIVSSQIVTLCDGQSVMVGANTYTTAGIYTDVIPSQNTCDSTVTTEVIINTTPIITVNSGSICAGQSFTMVPTGALTYTYSNGTDIVMPTANATYSVTGTDINGCVSSIDAVSSVTVNALPILFTSTTNTLLCTGETATLSVTGATSYTWSTTEITSDIAVTPTVQTTYTVDGLDVNGCVNSATITQDVSLCTGIVTLNGVEAQLISVYPNPNNGLFIVELNATSQVIVTNALGQVVITETMEAGKHNLDIHNQSTGIYFVKVILDGKQHMIKLIKE